MKKFLLFTYTLLILSCNFQTKQRLQKVETQIKNILEMPTYEHVYRDIIYFDKEKTFLTFKIMEKKLLFSVDIIVKAGFDLKKGFTINRVSNTELIVFLPDAEILLLDADEKSIHEFFILESGEKVKMMEYYDEINSNKEDIKNNAIERGILSKAEDNGKSIIRSLLRAGGFENIQFKKSKISGESNEEN